MSVFHFLTEVVLVAMMFYGTTRMLRYSAPYENRSGALVTEPGMYVYALFAWVPELVFGYLLWHLFTRHHSHQFNGVAWLVFGLLFAAGLVMTVLSAVSPQRNLLKWVIAAGVLMACVPLPYIGWFGVGSFSVWCWILGGLAAVLVVAGSVFALKRYRARNPGQNGVSTKVLAIAAVVAIVLGGFGVLIATQVGNSGNTTATTPIVTKTITPTVSGDKHKVIVDLVSQGLQQQGFTKSQMRFNNLRTNTATPGNDIFSQKMINTPTDAVSFMCSGTPQANAALQTAIQQTSTGGTTTTKSQICENSNWVAVQLNTPTDWQGNTFYDAGMKSAGQTKTDAAGTIAVVFVPPSQVAAGKVTSLFALRGACANPQTKLPKPHTPPTNVPTCTDTHTCQPPPPGCKQTHTCQPPPTCHDTNTCQPPKTCKDLYGPGYGDKNGNPNGFPPCYKAAVVGGVTQVPPPPTNAPGHNPAPVPVTVTPTPGGQPSAVPTSSQCYDPQTGMPVPPGTPGAWCS